VTRRPDGTLGGVSVAVAQALAAHLGVPVELKSYDNPARYNESLATDDSDIGLAARDPVRADHLAFSETFMEVDNGYVARAGVAPANADAVDRPGVKIAVAQGSAPHTVLQRLIKNAEIIPVPGGFEAARECWRRGGLTFTARTCTGSPHRRCLARRTRTVWPIQRGSDGHRSAQAGFVGASRRGRVCDPNSIRRRDTEGDCRSQVAGRTGAVNRGQRSASRTCMSVNRRCETLSLWPARASDAPTRQTVRSRQSWLLSPGADIQRRAVCSSR
jgi:hypothetical protein